MIEWSDKATYLEDCFCSVSLDVIAINYDLDDTVPDLLGDIIASEPDEVKDDIDVPLIVGGILFREDGYFEHHLFPDAVVGSLKVRFHFSNSTYMRGRKQIIPYLEIGEHLKHNVLGI